MTIDIKTGDLIAGAERLGPSLAESEFLQTVLGKSANVVRQTPTRNWYEIWLPDASGREVGVILAFLPGGNLQRINLKFLKPQVRAAGWPGWSEEVEDEMKVFHDAWLRQQLRDPPYDFPWGWATSVIDLHGYSAVIIIDYGPRPQVRQRAVRGQS